MAFFKNVGKHFLGPVASSLIYKDDSLKENLGAGFGGPGQVFLDEKFLAPDKPGPSESDEILEEGRTLALQGVPLQVSMLLQALSELRARATGSTAEILPAVTSQINDLREQYRSASDAISRRLGPSAGGQSKRQRQRLLTEVSQGYGNILNNAQEQGFAGYLNLLGGIQPLLSNRAQEPSVSTEPAGGPNAELLGKSLAGIASLGQQFVNQNNQNYANQTIANYRSNPAYTVGLPNTPDYTEDGSPDYLFNEAF